MSAAAFRGQRTNTATGLFCFLLILSTLVINQTAVHWRQNLADSHLFAYYGWCVAQGAVPYVDIWDNKPPAIWWVNGLGFFLCGDGLAGELLICTTALALGLAAFVGIAHCAYHPSILPAACLVGCTLLAHLTFEGGANRTETFVAACESLAIFCYLRWQRQRRCCWLALAGFAAGCAPLFKQSGLSAALACSLHLAASQFSALRQPRSLLAASSLRSQTCPPVALRHWLAAAGGFFAPLILAGCLLATQGALHDAWFATGPFNRVYFDIGDASWIRIDRAVRIFAEVLRPLAGVLLFAAAGIGLLLASAARRRSIVVNRESFVGLFWLWFLLAAYFACVGPGRRGHHFLPALAPLGLLALYPLEMLSRPEGLWARLLHRPSRAAVLVIFCYAVGLLMKDHLAQCARCWQQKTTWYGLSYAQPPGFIVQAEQVRRLTSPADRIYVWGWSPGTYRYAYRLPASRFATLEKVGQLRGTAQWILEGVQHDLKARTPRVVVISPADLRGIYAHRDDPFTRWLISTYTDTGPTGGMHLLVGKSPATAAARVNRRSPAAARSWECSAADQRKSLPCAGAGSRSPHPRSGQAGTRSSPYACSRSTAPTLAPKRFPSRDRAIAVHRKEGTF